LLQSARRHKRLVKWGNMTMETALCLVIAACYVCLALRHGGCSKPPGGKPQNSGRRSRTQSRIATYSQPTVDGHSETWSKRRKVPWRTAAALATKRFVVGIALSRL
jgi:hypothetical protein